MGKPFGSTLELKHLATPAGKPPAGALLLYVKSDGKVYSKDSAGVESPVSGATEAYVQSRGMNLVTNGTGYLRNNTNFSWGTFVPTDHPVGSHGSFLSATSVTSGRYIDESIPVDAGTYYNLAFWLRQTVAEAAGAAAYGAINPLDIDGLTVGPQSYMFRRGTTTALTQDLNPGDTVIHLGSVENWNNAAGAASHWRTLIFWDYVDGTGYLWPPETYSRNYYANVYDDGAINATANTITLREPWAGPAKPAGTLLSNGGSGQSLIYVGALNTAIPTVWTRYTDTIGGIHEMPTTPGAAPVSSTGGLPHGTVAIKFGFLMNRNNIASRMAAANLWLSEVAAENLADGSIQTAKLADQAVTLAKIGGTGTRNTTTFLRGDGTFAVPPNTTYAVPTQAEAEAGTATTGRAFSAQRVKQAIDFHAKVFPVEAATTGPLTSMTGNMVIDGAPTAAGMAVLVKNEANPLMNGVYVVATGAWSRHPAYATAADVAGAVVRVKRGTMHGGQLWKTDFKSDAVWGVAGQTWHQVLDSSLVPSQAEAEAGTAATPRAWTSERVKQAIHAQTRRKIVVKAALAEPSGARVGARYVDDVWVNPGDRVLLIGEGSADRSNALAEQGLDADNGVWIISDGGWVQEYTPSGLGDAEIYVLGGTQNGRKTFLSTAGSGNPALASAQAMATRSATLQPPAAQSGALWWDDYMQRLMVFSNVAQRWVRPESGTVLRKVVTLESGPTYGQSNGIAKVPHTFGRPPSGCVVTSHASTRNAYFAMGQSDATYLAFAVRTNADGTLYNGANEVSFIAWWD